VSAGGRRYDLLVQLKALWWNIDWQSRHRTVDQIAAVRSLHTAPDVVGLCELQRRSFTDWRDALESDGYTVVDSDRPDGARKLRVLLAVKRELRPVSRRRFASMRPGAVASAEIQQGGRRIEVHAVGVPNGTTNGWVKIDHLWALRAASSLAPTTRPR
jgi:hypothetical protein